MNQCAFCGTDVGDPRSLGRRDTCRGCGRDLHSCLQCRFWDRARYNECREPRAEGVRIKDVANFCDYFELLGNPRKELTGNDPAKEKAKNALDQLFKK